MSHVYSKAMSSLVEGDRVAIHWIFELTEKSGKLRYDTSLRAQAKQSISRLAQAWIASSQGLLAMTG
jgi:hypothetical protein